MSGEKPSVVHDGRESAEGNMRATVFYSWQSDSPNSTNRNFVESALEKAIKTLNDSGDIEGEIVLDKDTQGEPGTPPVTETILKKIRECSAFVPDISFVGKTEAGRLIPNPNVLIEYGYALSVLRHGRLVPVMNTEHGEPTAQTLPFDMHQLRHPMQYHLPAGADGEMRKSVKERLVKELTAALRAILTAAGSGGTTQSDPGGELSGQARSILRQLVDSGAKEVGKIVAQQGVMLLLQPVGGNVTVTDPLYLDDDLAKLVDEGWVNLRYGSTGTECVPSASVRAAVDASGVAWSPIKEVTSEQADRAGFAVGDRTSAGAVCSVAQTEAGAGTDSGGTVALGGRCG